MTKDYTRYGISYTDFRAQCQEGSVVYWDYDRDEAVVVQQSVKKAKVCEYCKQAINSVSHCPNCGAPTS